MMFLRKRVYPKNQTEYMNILRGINAKLLYIKVGGSSGYH